MDRERSMLFSAFIRRLFLWFSSTYLSIIMLASLSRFGISYFLYTSFFHVVSSIIVLSYLALVHIKYSLSFCYTKENHRQIASLLISIICMSLVLSASIFRPFDCPTLARYFSSFALLIFHQKHVKANTRLLLPIVPPNLWQSVKKIVMLSILDSLRSFDSLALLSVITVIFGYLFDHEVAVISILFLFVDIYLRSSLLLFYLLVLYRGLVLVLLFPINFAKLPQMSSTSAISFPPYSSMKTLLSVLNSDDNSNKSDLKELLSDSIQDSQAVNNGLMRMATSSSSSSNLIGSTLPRFQRLANYQIKRFSKLSSQCTPCTVGYPIISYFNSNSIISSGSSVGLSSLVIKSLALQNLNKDIRLNHIWKAHLFGNEELFTETVLTSCFFIDAMAAQLQLIVSHGAEVVLKSHLQLPKSSGSISKLQQQYSQVQLLAEKEVQSYLSTWSDGLNWPVIDIIRAGIVLRNKSWLGKVTDNLLKKKYVQKSTHEWILSWSGRNEIDINNAFPPMLIQAAIHAIESLCLLMQFALQYDTQGYSIHFVYVVLNSLVGLHITMTKYEELLHKYYSLYPTRKKLLNYDSDSSNSIIDSNVSSYFMNKSNSQNINGIKAVLMKYPRQLLNNEGIAVSDAVNNGIDILLRCYKDQLVLYQFPANYNTIIRQKLSGI